MTLKNSSDFYEKKYFLHQEIEKIWKIDFKERFKSTDPNCPVYLFELLPVSGSKNYNPMFEIDPKKFDISIKKNYNVGIYTVLLHPVSHKSAQSL